MLYEELTAKLLKYMPEENLELIHRAYMTAKNAHMDQRRKSGELYVIHPLCVAIILADLELDKDTIIAGLLHDIIEDTILNKSQLSRIFGADVADLVDGVTKLTRISINGDKSEEQAENLRKMFVAMSKDIRVLLIKLADRLHNMRTLKYMKPEKQKEKSRETLDIYSPLAERLGISKIKDELDDIALRYLEPDVYADIEKKMSIKMDVKKPFIGEKVREIKEYMEDAGIRSEVKGRVKHLFSIYKKMVRKNQPFDQIYDIFALRIIVDSVKDCYAALGVIHEHYKPIPGRFKDYIAMPKSNMYQSLHSTLIGNDGQPFEIQIRTYEMHRIAEFGIAAHWHYKESGSTRAEGNDAERMNWLRQILEIQTDNADNKEFLNVVKSDLNLFEEDVYCFTPTGEVKTLPRGSTPIDFAYSIHSAVGNKMVGARVNGQLVHIDYQLNNGDRVEVITSQNSRGPSRDWLSIVKSPSARSKINQWFKANLKEDNIVRGRELVDHYCKIKGIRFDEINKPEIIENVAHRYSYTDWDSLLAAIGHGSLKEGQVINRMVAENEKISRKQITDEEALKLIKDSESKSTKVRVAKSGDGIVVKGVHDLAVRFSRCCSPIPGDEIVGFVTRGRGISIHRTDCVNVINMPEEDRNRMIPAEWQKNENEDGSEKYLAELAIYAYNRIGLMVEITRIFSEKGIDIASLNTRTAKNGTASIMIAFRTHGIEEIRSITEKLRQIEGVRDIERTTG